MLAHAQPSINEIIPTESAPLNSTFGGIYSSGIQTTQPRNLTRRSRRPKRLEESEERKKEAAALPLTGLIFPRISTAGAPLNFSESSPSKSSLQASRLNGLSGRSMQDVNSGSRDFILEESSTAAVASIKGLKPGNPNWINQDNFILIENFDQRGINFYCVLDGHGEHGHHVSRRCREMLPEYIRIANQDLKRAFFLMQSDLQASSGFDANCSGATCAFVSMQNKKLTVANCGDSRVVLCSRVHGLMQARALSTDHKPDRLEERKRIISCGGRLGCRQVVVNDHGLAVPAGPCRVWYTYRGDSMGLAMSRSLNISLFSKDLIILIVFAFLGHSAISSFTMLVYLLSQRLLSTQ